MPNTQPVQHIIRVQVAESSPIQSQLLAEAIGRDRRFKIVTFTANSFDVIKSVLEYRPDILLISASLEEEPGRGFNILRELAASHSSPKAVMLLDSSKPETVVQAFRSGARGVFCRSGSVKNLCKCITVVHAGQIWANSEELGYILAALVAAPSLRPGHAHGLNLLSQRERDVVGCLAEGLSNREIAQHLSISQHTVKNYMFRIFDKLGVSSRVELLFCALSQSDGIHGFNNKEDITSQRGLGLQQVNPGQVLSPERKAVGSPEQSAKPFSKIV